MENLQIYQQQISRQLRAFRKKRHFTQIELARFLDISQPRLSEIERGNGSLSAEQFLILLREFNLNIQDFISEKESIEQTLQNTLFRLGSTDLNTIPGLPSERIKTINEAIIETLCDASSSRLIINLIPIIIKNSAQIDEYKLNSKLEGLGYKNRLKWIIEGSWNVLRIRLENYLPRNIQKLYRVADVRLGGPVRISNALRTIGRFDIPEDVLDADITSQKTLDAVKEKRDELAKKWKIVTRITQQDMLNVLIVSEKDAR